MYVTRLMRDMQNFSFQRQRLVVLPTFDLLPRSAFFFCQEIVGGGIVGVLYYMPGTSTLVVSHLSTFLPFYHEKQLIIFRRSNMVS